MPQAARLRLSLAGTKEAAQLIQRPETVLLLGYSPWVPLAELCMT